MRYLAKQSDANLKLTITDSKGNAVDISSQEVVKSFKIVVYTSQTELAKRIVIENDFTKVKDCTLRLQSEDVDKLARGQVMIDCTFKFYTSDTSDGYYDLRKTISSNIVLTE